MIVPHGHWEGWEMTQLNHTSLQLAPFPLFAIFPQPPKNMKGVLLKKEEKFKCVFYQTICSAKDFNGEKTKLANQYGLSVICTSP